jgi:hypothetical protein
MRTARRLQIIGDEQVDNSRENKASREDRRAGT